VALPVPLGQELVDYMAEIPDWGPEMGRGRGPAVAQAQALGAATPPGERLATPAMAHREPTVQAPAPAATGQGMARAPDRLA
jgi:hypothetical protein